jgi:hypothetical protein
MSKFRNFQSRERGSVGSASPASQVLLTLDNYCRISLLSIRNCAQITHIYML